MRYLDALLARKPARPELTEPTEPHPRGTTVPGEGADKTDIISDLARCHPSVSFVSDPEAPVEPRSVATAGTGEGIDLPLSDDARPPCSPPYPWRAELSGWPIPWREAWGRLSNQLEEAEGLCWWRAERRAHAAVSRLKEKGGIGPGATPDFILSRLGDQTAGDPE